MGLDTKALNNIKEYYSILGLNAIVDQGIFATTIALLRDRKDSIVISDRREIRGIAKLLGCKRTKLDNIALLAEQYFALCDALLVLSKKNVPVYFYNRIGLEKNGFEYSDTAKERMKQQLSFPVMYEDIDKYSSELREIYGDKFSKEYVEELGKIPQVIEKGNIYCHEDYAGKYVNVINGKRITCYQPKSYAKTIHVYGRCGAFGYAVEDAETIPSQLQKELLDNGYDDIRVVNHGLWGGEDTYLDHNFLHDVTDMKEGDIVLFYRKHYDKKILQHMIDRGLWYKEITHEWHEFDIARYSFFDKPGHMSSEGYAVVAKLICQDLIDHAFTCGTISESISPEPGQNLTAYLKKYSDSELQKGVKDYTAGILKQYPVLKDSKNNGSIVMNCNPFTKGHRYLVEYAAKQVDWLCIFVVEEDKSFFKFEDRFAMVKDGVKGLENVIVVPSGNFIISSITFPEYFMKDYVKEKNFDVSMDVQVFCRYIAPELNIKVRFAGEEPFDPVTLNYNENMSRILPEYGMEFCEIPRMKLDNGEIVNATQVRSLLKDKKYEELEKYVPHSTYRLLMEKYAH